MEGNLEQNADFPRAFLELLEQNPNRLLAALVINELAKRGITRYYLSPGHRNAPLMAAILHHPCTEIESVIDERIAGYRALGYASHTQKCPALVCTSGTALANYYPSLIEAWSSDLPLLIISADRLPQQVQAGENQTIVQSDIYAHFAPSLKLNTLWHEPLSLLPQKLNDFIPIHRPCHINIPFQEPLGSQKREIDHRMKEEGLALLKTSSPNTNQRPKESANIEQLFVDNIGSPLIVVGEVKSLSERNSLLPLLKETPLPFYLDVTSGLKYQFNLNDGVLPGFDHPETAECLKEKVDTVLHIGGRVTSKEYYRFLQNNKKIAVFNVSSSEHRWDPALRTQQFIRYSPESLRSILLQHYPSQKWELSWAEEKIRWVSQSPLSFPQISKALIEIIPEGNPLFLGNSTAIRSFDNYLSFGLKKDIPVYYNRGVSGIEGHIASALGIAEGSGKMTTVILGDISFLHDLGSLPSVAGAHPGLIIVLVNDGGGGIFNLLPTSEEKDILSYMTTPHRLSFKATAEQFNLPYRTATNSEELIQSYQSLLKKGLGLLEVMLDPQNNLKVYQRLKTLREAPYL